METKQKEQLLKENLFNNIEFKVDQTSLKGELFFGDIHKGMFRNLSSSYFTGRINDKLVDNPGFYVKCTGPPTKVDLENDKVYEEGGKLVIEKN